jgi:hypothetical protein
MKGAAFDRRPGIKPPAPPDRPTRLTSRPKAPFFDVKTSVFLILSAWLLFYLADRIFFEGAGCAAVADTFGWVTRRL